MYARFFVCVFFRPQEKGRVPNHFLAGLGGGGKVENLKVQIQALYRSFWAPAASLSLMLPLC